MLQRLSIAVPLLVLCGCAADPGLPAEAGEDAGPTPMEMGTTEMDMSVDAPRDMRFASDIATTFDAGEDTGPDFGEVDCDPGTACSGSCVDTQTSIEHCGSCDSPCEPPGDARVESCTAGVCVFACDTGRFDANGDLQMPGSDGCESDCVPSGPEVCDGSDNDCNGQVDDGLGGATCDTQNPGICALGTESCIGGAIQCVQESSALPEVCNGRDDSCDGTTDEGCPNGVSVTNFRDGPRYGGSGGSLFRTECPGNMVITGFSGRSGSRIDRLQGECRGLELVEDSNFDPFEYTAESTGTSLNLPAQGGTGGSLTSAYCPQAEVVIGIFGREDSEVDRLQIQCGRIEIEDLAQGFAVQRVATVNRNFGGGNGGSAFSYTCPGESVVTGIFGRDGSRIDALGVQCADVTVSIR